MQMAEFVTPNGKRVAVNPAQVTYVIEDDPKKTDIQFAAMNGDGESYVPVVGSFDEVRNSLDYCMEDRHANP